MRYFSAIFFSLATIAMCWVLDGKQFASVPLAGGRFLDPFNGFWQNAEAIDAFPAEEELRISGLEDKVSIVYDARRVPHVFAQNDHDLYFTQGFVTARDRLWQMEFQVKAAAGELSEIISDPRVLNLDREKRRRGMVKAAETALEESSKDPQTKGVLDAYTAGVNAWIAQLSPAEFPVEYKLLDYSPEPWTNLRTNLLLKMMAWSLSGRTTDFSNSNALQVLGWERWAELYPERIDSAKPIIPTGTAWNFTDTLPVPVAPNDSIPTVTVGNLQYSQPHPSNGSNNWAVHGSKTASGYPILCNDPHLSMSLPAIWYEIQLSTPDHSVYGVSLPGSPAVIIGFNQDCAWGVTNSARDVMDWYQIEFRDETRSEYRYDGGWAKTEIRIEPVRRRGAPTLIDTVLYTVHGPVVFDRNFNDPKAVAPLNLAMRWVAHDPSNELKTFCMLNRAKTEADYREALSHFVCPGQNFVFASKDNDIAITQQGKFPNKWEGQGLFVMDGSNPAHEWSGFIPWEQNPYVKNPSQGFVFSANQNPVGPSYPYRTDGYYDHTRSRRISQVLDGMNKITAKDMMDLQNDDYNLLSAEVLPQLLAQLEDAQLTGPALEARAKLKSWTNWNEADLEAPLLFYLWKWQIASARWNSEFAGADHEVALPRVYPTLHALASQLNDSVAEVRLANATLLSQSLVTAVEELALWQSENPDLSPTWVNYNNARVVHLSRQKAFSHYRLATGGDKSSVNAIGGNHGPSWRMIVELGPEPKAYGTYPGGPSGNPGSPWYDIQLEEWTQGEYQPLYWLESPETGGQSVLNLEPLKQ